jgi:putative oxidoreductase
MLGRAGSEPKPIFPGLAGFYAFSSDFSYLIVRLTAGGILLAHGWVKLGFGLGGVTGSMVKNGFVPGTAFAATAMFLETVGAVCIMLGLFTRFFAVAAAIELFCITYFVSMPHGFSFSSPGGGGEFPLMWSLIMFAIALRGGGPYSLDRKIGKEL